MSSSSSRRELTHAQKRTKNERDRQRRFRDKMEFKRLQRVEEEAKSLRDQIRYLTEENKRLNDMPSNSEIGDQLHQNYREAHQINLGLQQTCNQEMKEANQLPEVDSLPDDPVESPSEPLTPILEQENPLQPDYEDDDLIPTEFGASKGKVAFGKIDEETAKSWLDFDKLPSPNEEIANIEPMDFQAIERASWSDLVKFLSPNEEVANNEPIITQCPGSSQSATQHADEPVEDFIKKLDVKEKSNVGFSDFDGLVEEMTSSGIINSLPPSLAPIDSKMKVIFGEIDADSTQSSCTAMPNRILFCAAIKEMNTLQLEQIDKRKILLWRNAINCALNINFRVEFDIRHLKKIARAYYGLKARREQVNDPELMSIVEKISRLVNERACHRVKACSESRSANF